MRDAGSPTCAAPRADFGRPGRFVAPLVAIGSATDRPSSQAVQQPHDGLSTLTTSRSGVTDDSR